MHSSTQLKLLRSNEKRLLPPQQPEMMALELCAVCVCARARIDGCVCVCACLGTCVRASRIEVRVRKQLFHHADIARWEIA